MNGRQAAHSLIVAVLRGQNTRDTGNEDILQQRSLPSVSFVVSTSLSLSLSLFALIRPHVRLPIFGQIGQHCADRGTLHTITVDQTTRKHAPAEPQEPVVRMSFQLVCFTLSNVERSSIEVTIHTELSIRPAVRWIVPVAHSTGHTATHLVLCAVCFPLWRFGFMARIVAVFANIAHDTTMTPGEKIEEKR